MRAREYSKFEIRVRSNIVAELVDVISDFLVWQQNMLVIARLQRVAGALRPASNTLFGTMAINRDDSCFAGVFTA